MAFEESMYMPFTLQTVQGACEQDAPAMGAVVGQLASRGVRIL